MLELIAVDGVPVGAQAQELSAAQSKTPALALLQTEMAQRAQEILDGQARIMSLLIGQQQEIARLNAALATVRISRGQELALNQAIRARTLELARTENLPGCEKRIAGAIRTTLRETTGTRAAGDLAASQFDGAMEMIGAWHMTGALRKIRREAKAHEQP